MRWVWGEEEDRDGDCRRRDDRRDGRGEEREISGGVGSLLRRHNRLEDGGRSGAVDGC